MKQYVPAMLTSVYNNKKKLYLFIELLTKFIRKKIGPQKKGKKRMKLKNVIWAILYYLKTGCQWRMIPSEFGNWRSIYGWYNKITKLKIFETLWINMVKFTKEKQLLNVKNISFDGSLVLTVSSISLKNKNPRMKNKNCLNRLIVCDKKGNPIACLLEKGTAHDTNFLIPLLDQVKSRITLPKNFKGHADKGFDSLSNRWEISKLMALQSFLHAIKVIKLSIQSKKIA